MKRFIKKFLLENWSLKATALLLSLILWLFVHGEPGPESVVRIPIQVQLPRQMEIMNERPTMVEVTMRGAVFSNIWFAQPLPNCIINMQGASEGKHAIELSPENVFVPKGSRLEILHVNPSSVTIVLQRTLSKEVPVVALIRGEPARGFEIYGKQVKPATAIITGPRSHIEHLSEIQTEAVSINDQKQPERFFVNLNLKDDLLHTSLNNPVQVDIQIGPRRKLYIIAQVPVQIDNPVYVTSPKKLTIQVKAPINPAADLTSADFSVMVDTRNINDSDLPVRVKPEIRLTRNVNGLMEIKQVQPPEVTVQAKRR
jgi:YbbR domain-containing protein